MLDNNFCPQLNITYNCNLFCSYCYENSFSYEKRIMDTEEVKNLFAFFNSLGLREATLIGGEPTIHPDFDTILSLAKKNNISLRLFTNGLFSEKTLESLTNATHVKEIYFHITDKLNSVWHNNFNKLSPLKNLWLRINIRNSEDIARIKDIIADLSHCNKFRIGYSLNCPHPNCGDDFVNITSGETNQGSNIIYKKIFDFLVHCINLNIKVYPGRPLFKCEFTPSEWEYLVNYANAKSICVPLDDISFDPGYMVKICSVFNTPRYQLKELTKSNLERIVSELEKLSKDITRKPTVEKCSTCEDFPNICQGGCLAYKIY